MDNLIDTHFHIDHYKNYHEIAREINNLKQYTICVTNSPGLFLACKNTISETKYLKFALGFHPLESGIRETDIRSFLHLISRTNYVGEIGLDYSKSAKLSKEHQIQVFEAIVKKCSIENKLMTIHIRRGENDAINVIRKYSPQKCIIHWFSGSENQLIDLLDLGCYMSINTNMISNKNSEKYHSIPYDRLLIESDGPYTKVNGLRYEPSLLKHSYELISDFYGLSNLESVVYSNFKRILKK